MYGLWLFMTIILALDSSTDACSVALNINGAITHQFEIAAKSHTQRLLPMVDEILRAQHCQLQDVDAIAFARGPGSFTGLRICMGVVQGLAFGANLQVIPISTLQAMAQRCMKKYPECSGLPVLAALDARMDEVYWGLYAGELQPRPLLDEHVMRPADVVLHADITALDRQFVAVGSGWHYADFESILPVRVMMDIYPDAQSIAELAESEFAQSKAVSIVDVQPVYLRDTISWQKRQRIRTQPI
jgi:tRNA threonylcarbamoyladenosine biosynthesis protein TsaB